MLLENEKGLLSTGTPQYQEHNPMLLTHTKGTYAWFVAVIEVSLLSIHTPLNQPRQALHLSDWKALKEIIASLLWEPGTVSR